MSRAEIAARIGVAALFMGACAWFLFLNALDRARSFALGGL